ncbi:hypothetical protein [Kutzneria albida]|uniref:Pycsar effector protein domain-containing protein n=1 Tax=Kutzneria albida DSM 43870 TaxID=1449976 RepID=W5WKB6_9PSEU|nr:hypothetical protein [Kutzneria albida]AHI01022.1 hypothetical protein KALB_7664 [Kutzneria albida DSM 43870]
MTAAQPEHGTDEGLGVALTTVASFQGAVQHADDKIRTIAALLGTLAAFVAAQLALFAKPAYGVTDNALVIVALCAFVLSNAAAGLHLFRGLTPRTGIPEHPNRFAFPSVAVHPSATCWVPEPVAAQREDALRLARVLARLAMAKNRHVRWGLLWTAGAYFSSLVMLVAFLVSR